MPTKTSRAIRLDQDIVQAWSEALNLFNQGDYWNAHERFEHRWTTLPPIEKLYLQTLIQACAVFYHLEKSRPGPASLLCESVISKLARLQGDPYFINHFDTRPQIDELVETIEDIHRCLSESAPLTLRETQCSALLAKAKKLRARWLNSTASGSRL